MRKLLKLHIDFTNLCICLFFQRKFQMLPVLTRLWRMFGIQIRRQGR